MARVLAGPPGDQVILQGGFSREQVLWTIAALEAATPNSLLAASLGLAWERYQDAAGERRTWRHHDVLCVLDRAAALGYRY